MNAEAFLDVRNVTHRYGARVALDRLSFAVAPGQIFGLLGPNGSGKTTLFRLLSTLAPFQEGDATLAGRNYGGSLEAIRRMLGVVFQSPSLDRKLTIFENLKHQGHLHGMTGAALRARIDSLLVRFGLAERRADLVETLSGGLQRRVEVAKGLLHAPRLLLLDEPTTGLDPAARRELWTYLEEINAAEGIAMIVTTHLMDEAERCGRIMILDRGVKVALDHPLTLKTSLGGMVVSIRARQPADFAREIEAAFQLKPQMVAETVRVEHLEGGRIASAAQLAGEILERFPGRIEAITLSPPTLEDVFLHLTGRRFAGDEEAGEAP